jgi:hypothetical protein
MQPLFVQVPNSLMWMMNTTSARAKLITTEEQKKRHASPKHAFALILVYKDTCHCSISSASHRQLPRSCACSNRPAKSRHYNVLTPYIQGRVGNSLTISIVDEVCLEFSNKTFSCPVSRSHGTLTPLMCPSDSLSCTSQARSLNGPQ